MTAEQFDAAITALWGPDETIARAAEFLMVNKVSVRRWASGDHIPPGVVEQITKMVHERVITLSALSAALVRS